MMLFCQNSTQTGILAAFSGLANLLSFASILGHLFCVLHCPPHSLVDGLFLLSSAHALSHPDVVLGLE